MHENFEHVCSKLAQTLILKLKLIFILVRPSAHGLVEIYNQVLHLRVFHKQQIHYLIKLFKKSSVGHPYEVLWNIIKFLQFLNTKLKVMVVITFALPENFFLPIKRFQDLKYPILN